MRKNLSAAIDVDAEVLSAFICEIREIRDSVHTPRNPRFWVTKTLHIRNPF